MEQAGPELRRLRVGEERAVVGHHLHAQAEHLPVALQRQLAVHVVVAGEPGRDQVLGARLDPLHRLPDQERRGRRDHVAGVDRDLVPEPAAEVGGDDPDVLLGQPGHHREQRPVHVRRLRGHVDRGLAGRRSSRPPRSRKSPAGPGGSAGRTCRARRRRRRRRTPAPWPRRLPPPSGSSGCRSGPPSRRGSAARPRPAPCAGPRPPAAARSRPRSARTRRAAMDGSVAITAATSCPWKRTLSVASTAWVSPDSVGIQASPWASRSLPVTTATTPGISCGRARVDARDLGVRRAGCAAAPCGACPGRRMSSTKLPWPRIRRSSSTRRRLWPIPWMGFSAVAISRLLRSWGPRPCPRPGSPSRCSCSPCSGRGCRRSPTAPRRRWGRVLLQQRGTDEHHRRACRSRTGGRAPA